MTFDHDQAAAWLQRERELAARGVKRGRKPAAQTPVTRDAKLLPVDWRLLGRLKGYGPHGIWPGVPQLASELGVSGRTVQRSLRRLEATGLVECTATFQRPDDEHWTPRRQHIEHFGQQDTNTYRVLDPGDTTIVRLSRERPAQTPVTPPESVTRVSPLNSEAITVSRGTVGAASLEPVEIPVEPPAALQLADDPSYPEIVATLEQGFGAVQVEQAYPNQLAGSLAAFHKAADRLDRSACWGNGDRCQPGYRCRRHTRRERT